MNNCTCNKNDELRIVRGNAFSIRLTVRAYHIDGTPVDDFDLSQANAELKIDHAGTKTEKNFTVIDNDALIGFDNTLGLGWYGLEMTGTYNDAPWRWCVESVFCIVETNAKANLPAWATLTDETYLINITTSITSGDIYQSDWAETNPQAPSYIQNKPDIYTKDEVNTRIGAEAQARQQADQSLQQNINNEAQARQQADGVLDGKISAIEAKIPSAASSSNKLVDTNTLTNGLAQKQDVINDLQTIREGAAAGATAYQKPGTGIPSTDMSEAVQSSLEKANTALQSQEQADWNESDSTKADYIKNKPTIPAAQVNSDWNASSGVAEILNKPTIPDVTGKADKVPGAISGDFAALDANGNLTDSGKKASDFQATISDLQTIREGAAAGATAYQKPGTGIPSTDMSEAVQSSLEKANTALQSQEQADWNESDSTKADYIKNKPTIPAAQVNSDWNASSGVAEILNKPTIPDVTGKADKVPGAVSGDFAALDANGNLTDSGKKASDFQSVLTFDGTPTAGSTNPVQSGGIKTYVDNKTDAQDTVIANAIAAQDAKIDRRMDAQDTEIDDRMDAQDAIISTLNGNDVIVGALPGSGVANKIYRVPGTTSYTDYMWNGTQFVPIATYSFPGIDDEPTKGSQNLVSSGGVYDYTKELYESVSDPYGWTDGKYIDTDGVEQSRTGCVITDYIPVEYGDEFIVSYGGGGYSAGYAYDSNKENPYQITPRNNNNVSNIHVYICRSSFAYIRFSTTSAATKSVVKINKDTYEKTLDNVSDMISDVYDDLSSGAVVGKYIGSNGTVITPTVASVINGVPKYKEFLVYNGTKIELQSLYSQSGVAYIAKKLADGSYKALVTQTEAASFPYTYTCQENMTVAVSCYGTVQTNAPSRPRIRITTYYAKSAFDNVNEMRALEIVSGLRLGFMFDNIAVIGDSMSVGTISSEIAADTSNNFGASWLSLLAKRWVSRSLYHYAKAGTTSYQWLNDASIYGLGVLYADTKVYNAYFIAYGHNETENPPGGITPIPPGTANDEAAPVTISGGVPSCPSGYSFCSYYKAIINQIRTKAPNAMIFCLSEYDNLMAGSMKTAYRQGVIDIVEQYIVNGDHLIYHLETGGVPNPDMALGSHYSTIGYAYIAQRVDEEVMKKMYENMGDSAIKSFGYYNGYNVRGWSM